ncbi:MAG: polysaccharide deacetylase [Candidatus Cellulosilyticum pullistercoris]|uniref:Polysaccharide deacetylase n=1 Tax=Candidatus Cellulosilyticum pullistercoris TaxID=2838521 RepID=A0A9E2KBW2_9FIRM|nr:polysaccharide deacetylase [Candidatus Cellulosilyticum pullistercoris]
MGYSKRKSKAKRTILFLALGTVFTMGTVTLGMKIPGKVTKLNEVKETMAKVQASKEEQAKILENLGVQVETLNTQLETLKADLNKAKEKNPELAATMANTETKYAYLTFDDGPSDNTTKILDFLKANNIKATFFVIGKDNMDDIYKRIVDEGHTLAIHSNTHDYKGIYQSVDTFMEDINTLANHLEKVTGVRPTIMRFPGGSNNTVSQRYGGEGLMDQIIETINEAGYTYFDWNVDSMDASASHQDKNVIINSVLNGAANKKEAIILMHDAAAKTTTVEALPQIVEGLRKKGFVFDKITNETPTIQFK